MKKIILTALALALLSVLGCDDDANAELLVENQLGEDIQSLSLTGAENTGNLIDGVLEHADQTAMPIYDLVPGKYKWHVKFVDGALIQEYDHPDEIELYPGRNNLVLVQGL